MLASLDDQMVSEREFPDEQPTSDPSHLHLASPQVPIYSACFTAAQHPMLLRLLYVNATISESHDFIIDLIALGLMLLNSGIDDQGLIGHLSEATAGAWRGAGHSTPYEDFMPYDFTVKYLLSTHTPPPPPPSSSKNGQQSLQVDAFTAKDAKNDYELPWILRGVMDDPEARILFEQEIAALKQKILLWEPNTRALKEIKRRVSCPCIFIGLVHFADGHESTCRQLEPMAGRAAIRLHQQQHRLQKMPSTQSMGSVDSNKQGGTSEGQAEQAPVALGPPATQAVSTAAACEFFVADVGKGRF